MNMAHIGIGVGAFTDGLMNGLQIGRTIKKVRQENEIEKIQKAGIEDARAEQQRQMDSRIQATNPAADGIGPERFQVGDKTFKNRDDARDAVKGDVDSVTDLFLKNAAPRIQETYLAQGDVERAEAWGGWIKSKKGENAVRDWSQGYRAAQMGDWDKAASSFGKYYTDYIDDDVDYVSHETLKDDAGNVTGFTIKMKDKSTGKETEMPLGTEELVNLGMTHNPQALFDTVYQNQQLANKARLDDAQDQRKHDREQTGKIEMETLKAQLKDAGEQARFDRNINALREAGYSTEFIQRAMPSLLGVDTEGPYRKGASPEEMARMLHQERMSNDYNYQNMSPAEQRQALEADMRMIQGVATMFGGGQAAPQPPSGPAPATPAGQAAQGIPVLDTQTGQIIYR
jgi:hypothetical protein